LGTSSSALALDRRSIASAGGWQINSKGAIDTAVDRAQVAANVGPCAVNRSYPACLTPN